MILNSMKLRITNLIQRQTAVQNIVQSTAQNRETNIQKTENPATNNHKNQEEHILAHHQ